MNALDDYIDRVKNLPPAPRILVELLAILREDNAPAERIVQLVAVDPALTAKVLQRCNSAAWGRKEPVHDLPEAITVVGFNEIFRLVAGVVGESTLGGAQDGYGIAAGELWRHSVAAGMAARLMARSLRGEENLVFTAALLHDLGKLILSGFLAGRYAALRVETEHSGRSLLEAEQNLLGVDHAEVGARLLARWAFPEMLVSAVRHHHDPLAGCPYQELAAYVYGGDIIAHLVGYGYGYQAYAVRGRAEAMQLLELTARDIERLALQTDAALKAADWFAEEVP